MIKHLMLPKILKNQNIVNKNLTSLNLKVGDLVKLLLKTPGINKKQTFSARCISISKNKTYTFRNILDNVGVEIKLISPSPNILEYQIINNQKTHTSKLYFK